MSVQVRLPQNKLQETFWVSEHFTFQKGDKELWTCAPYSPPLAFPGLSFFSCYPLHLE